MKSKKSKNEDYEKRLEREIKRSEEKDKQIKKISREYQKAYDEVWKIMGPKGMECGNEIEKVAREIHGDDILVLPMYRSCACIMKQTKDEKENGIWRIIGYHDPHWMGQELNKETLPQFKEEFILHGQRSCIDLWRDTNLRH